MKQSLPALFSAVLLFAAVQNSQAVLPNTLDINLSSYNGGAQTLISWVFGGPILTSATAGGGILDTGMNAPGAFKNTFSSQTYAFSNGGIFTNLTTSVTKQIKFVGFYNNAYDTVALGWSLNPNPTTDRLALGGQSINYTPGTDSYVINQSYAEFNPGTYYYTNNQTTTPGLQVTLNIAPASVPEPSTYALLGLGAIGMLMVMRRKKTA
jgi:hypothetical protein